MITTTRLETRGVTNGKVMPPRRATGALAAVVSLMLSRDAAARDEPVKLRRIWVGLSGGFTTVFHPSGINVCGTTEWTCAQSDGGVFPNPNSSVASGSSNVSPGFGGLAGSLVSAIDVALTDGFLLGLRYGFYLHPINVNVVDFFSGMQSMWEARATWVLGRHPLTTRALAFRPYALFGVGLADFSAPVDTTLVVNSTVFGPERVTAWKIAGPFFITTGVGVRFGNERLGVMFAPLKIAAAFGSGATVAYMPELTMMSGF
jgi:hypothetical protein